jgi:hypothetical protein
MRLERLPRRGLLFLLGLAQLAGAATLCVSAKPGCYHTIAGAVAHASPNDTVMVLAGTYHEDVVIGMPLSLIGAGLTTTTIDATGLANGINVDGLNHSGLSNVTIAGLTIENANFEGIVVTNASSVTILNVHVTGNNKALNPVNVTCPGIPDWETAEGFDCGEGIHLSGVSYSIVSRAVVDLNSGGILLSDDTGSTHDNLVTESVVHDNPFDCGITLASHPPAAVTGASSPLGVYHNTISGNRSYRNGLAVGEGAGVGIFDSVPGAINNGNVVINNDLTDNGLPGVSMHSHTPGQDLNHNMIIGNHIARNKADSDDAATPGSTGINVFGVSPVVGTVITQNVIEQEQNDIVTNTPAQVDIHMNQLLGPKLGINNIGRGSVNGTLNWWGCVAGPRAPGCSSAGGPNVLSAPWLMSPGAASDPVEGN